MKRLMNKIAIVTGASREKGIGTAICRELAREGADIFFTHWSTYDQSLDYFINEDVGWAQQLMEEIRSFGVRSESMELDLSQIEAPEILLNEVQEKLGLPFILCK
ncbi:SDR family NAD(P)-dependent oxidoreductase [Paenibacillus lactis]